MMAETEKAGEVGNDYPTLDVDGFATNFPTPGAGTNESGFLQDEADIISTSSDRAARTTLRNIKPTPVEYAELSTKDLKKDKSSTRLSSASNLIGHINNLVTTDLGNIIDARDFMFVFIFIPLQFIACIAFLYWILGWR